MTNLNGRLQGDCHASQAQPHLQLDSSRSFASLAEGMTEMTILLSPLLPISRSMPIATLIG